MILVEAIRRITPSANENEKFQQSGEGGLTTVAVLPGSR